MSTEAAPVGRNPPWNRDELILALDLYFRHPPKTVSQTHDEVIRLSNILNTLPIHPVKADPISFRNPNGVYMKLSNFLHHDPTYDGTGLERGNKLEAEVWREFSADKDRLRRTAKAIVAGMPALHEKPLAYEDEEEWFPEGRVLFRLHRQRERSRAVVEKAKARAKAEGNLICWVCKFNFAARYGPVGEGFIESHHTVPISDYDAQENTRVEDIALVCANCQPDVASAQAVANSRTVIAAADRAILTSRTQPSR